MPALSPKALEEAAEWLMRLSEGDLNDSERAEWEHWKLSSPERDRAWARAQLLQNKLGGLPPSLAMSALDRPASPERRAALGKLALLLAVMPVGWGSELVLAEGARITLDTDTAIDVRFDSQQRLVHLREGEILVQTAHEATRPFLVSTRQGRMQALGTRFTVRELNARTHLAVLEGTVKVMLAENSQTAPLIVNAGQRTDFSAQTFGALGTADGNVDAWTRGMLMADKMRLADFVAELLRYRRGFVRCDPAIADLKISGAFPVSDSQRALGMLVQTYPVRVSGHLNGYWVTLSPA